MISLSGKGSNDKAGSVLERSESSLIMDASPQDLCVVYIDDKMADTRAWTSEKYGGYISPVFICKPRTSATKLGNVRRIVYAQP